jgi:hypothetical protein
MGFAQEEGMDRELGPVLAVMGELGEAGLATVASAAQLFAELAFRYGERCCRDILDVASGTAPSGGSERDLATELMDEYRACLRELAASSSRLSMNFLSHLEEARAERRRSVLTGSGD